MLHDVMSALRAGDAATASALARAWTEAEPGNPEAFLWAGHALAAAKDLPAAAAAFDRGLALAPDRAELLTARAYLDLQGRDLPKAEAGLGAALAQDPNQWAAYIALAQLALARGDRTEAERHVSYAKRIDADHPRLLVVEAQLAGLSGEADRVLPLLNAAAQRAPNDPLVQATLGLALLERQHHAFAAQALRNALALNPEVPALRVALISALEAQGQGEEVIAEAEAWIARQPEALPARWARARGMTAIGRFDEALDDTGRVLTADPRHAPAFDLAVRLIGMGGGPEAVLAFLNASVERDPGFALSWQTLLAWSPPEARGDLVRRWQAVAPEEAQALEMAALLAESEGLEGEALALAAEAIARDPQRLQARLLQARATAFLEPEAAVSRMDALMAATTGPDQVRALIGWRGVALHRAGRPLEALAAWQQMWIGGRTLGVPLPNPSPAASARPTEDGGAGQLLWGPPGSRVERVQAGLMAALPDRLLMDRWQQPQRDDGFNIMRVAPDDPRAGTAERWRAPLEAAGLEPAKVVDALPFWDGFTQATLHGTTLVAVLRDPRDLLLNWLAFGSSAGFVFPGPAMAAAWLQRLLEQLLEAEATAPSRVQRIDGDLIDRDPEAFRARLMDVWGLAEPPDLAWATAMGRHPNGEPVDFPAGAWRQYADPLKTLFEPLGALAVRLGYPAD